MAKTRILVVDDEQDAVSALQFRLEQAGYEVLTAEHGAAALEVLREEKVDVLLADFMMPELNGLELARMVKANPNWFDTRVILFSCNTDPEFRKRAMDLGALDYMPKTEGYTNIIRRLGEVAAPGQDDTVTTNGPLGDDSADEKAYREQLALLARSLVDMLHLAGLDQGLPDAARFALGSAQRIAADIEKLSHPDPHPERK